jgi:hypothetical protein
MKNWNKAVAKYSAESRNFDNADGSFVGARNNFAGEPSYANGQNSGGDIYSVIDDSNKFYTAVITNTTTVPAAVTAVVFGANQFSGTTQENSGVTVTISESSHAEARAASQTNPFWVNGLRYLTTTAAQMNGQILTIQNRSSNGETVTKQFRPLTFKTSYQQNALQVDAPSYKFLVDGSTSIRVPVIGSEVVTLVMQIGGRFDASNAVQGSSAIAVAGQKELSTGLVQVVR